MLNVDKMSMPYYNSLNRGIKNSSMRDSMRPARPYRSFHSYDAQVLKKISRLKYKN